MTDNPTKAQLAAKYAGWGWKVFPIQPGTKDRPLVKWGSEASDDPAVVARWWQRTPDANIGVAVGQSGLAVVDLDNKKAKVKGKPDKQGSKRWQELELDHGACPETLTARTPSGGFHLYFKGRVANTVDRLADGVDTRGAGGMGGYVLAPGSTTDQGEYSWSTTTKVKPLPQWIADKAGERKEERVQRSDIEVAELDTEAAVSWAVRWLEVDSKPAIAGEGGNNLTFRVACELREKGVSQDKIAELLKEYYSPRCDPPWTDEECDTFAKNAWAYAGVVAPGGDSAEAHFGGPSGWGRAGEPPSIEEFASRGARPLAVLSDAAKNVGQTRPSGSSLEDVSFRDNWVWIAQQQIFMRRSDKFIVNEKSFDSLFGYLGEKGKIAGQILSSNGMLPKFETLAFLPGKPEFAGPLYNTWVKPAIEPKAGDTGPFEEHMLRLLPDDEERAAALDWMAWVLQNEGLKPNFMFLMQGEQGCGKSWLGVLMSKLVDERNTTFLRTEDVGNRFNSWVLKTRLAVVEELMGDDKRTLANRMKALITQDTITVELKGKDLLTAANKAAFMAFTNHLDALRLENSDRRYMVFRTLARGLGTPTSYWDRLWRFLDGDGPAAVLAQLLVRPVDLMWGLGRAPHTKAHDLMRREGLPELERWLAENLEDRNPPFNMDLVCVSDVEQHLPQRLQRMNGLHKLIPTFLRDEAKATNLGAHRVPGTATSKRLWATRRGELYSQMEPKARIERYMKQLTSAPLSAVEDFNDDVVGEADSQDDPLA